MNKLEEMIVNAHEFGGDKGYDSKGNRQALRKRGIKTRIMYKKPKGKPMTIWQKRFNKAISKRRFRVEQTFGTLYGMYVNECFTCIYMKWIFDIHPL